MLLLPKLTAVFAAICSSLTMNGGPRFRLVSVLSMTALWVIGGLATGSTLHAAFTPEERETRDEQLRHLARIVDQGRIDSSEKNALLGMLILRDEAPKKTAGCYRATRHDSNSEFLRHVLACPRCSKILDVVRSDKTLPQPLAPLPTERAIFLVKRAERLVDDGYGYIPAVSDLGGKLYRALDLLEKALKDSPDYPRALQLFAALKESQGQTAIAEMAFRKAVNLCPTVPAGLHNFALLQMRQQMYEHAHLVLRYSIKHDPEHKTARLLAWLHNTPEAPGLVRRQLVSADEAIRLMEWVISKEDSPGKLISDYAYLGTLREKVSDRGFELHFSIPEKEERHGSRRIVRKHSAELFVRGRRPTFVATRHNTAARRGADAMSRRTTPRRISGMSRAAARKTVERAHAVLFGEDGLLDDSLLDDNMLEEGMFGERGEEALFDRLHDELLIIVNRSGEHQAEACHLMAMLSFRRGYDDEARRYAACAARLVPTSSRYHSNFAYMLQAGGRPSEARVLYDYARQLDPNNTSVHLGLLSLASQTQAMELSEIRALVRDWAARERVPELRKVAMDLHATLIHLASDLPALSTKTSQSEKNLSMEEMESIRGLLRTFFGPSSEVQPTPKQAGKPPKFHFSNGRIDV